MSYYSYSYSAAESYNSQTGTKKATYSAKEIVNGTVRRDVKAERIGEDQYVLYKHDGNEWIRDTNRGRYYTRANLEPYLMANTTPKKSITRSRRRRSKPASIRKKRVSERTLTRNRPVQRGG